MKKYNNSIDNYIDNYNLTLERDNLYFFLKIIYNTKFIIDIPLLLKRVILYLSKNDRKINLDEVLNFILHEKFLNFLIKDKVFCPLIQDHKLLSITRIEIKIKKMNLEKNILNDSIESLMNEESFKEQIKNIEEEENEIERTELLLKEKHLLFLSNLTIRD